MGFTVHEISVGCQSPLPLPFPRNPGEGGTSHPLVLTSQRRGQTAEVCNPRQRALISPDSDQTQVAVFGVRVRRQEDERVSSQVPVLKLNAIHRRGT
jgi:hypothetical protein